MLRVGDANDIERIEHALENSATDTGRPTLIVLDSHIGYGSPHKQDTAEAHGEPLGRRRDPADQARLRLARRREIPGARRRLRTLRGGHRRARREAPRKNGRNSSTSYRAQYPELAAEIDQMQRRELPAGWDRNLPVFPADAKGIAGREASGKVLNVLAQNIPWFLGGSADLGPSNKTLLDLRRRRSISRPTAPAGRTCTSASANTRWARSSTGCALSKLRRLWRDVLHLQRLRAARHPALGPDGVARDFRLHSRCDG